MHRKIRVVALAASLAGGAAWRVSRATTVAVVTSALAVWLLACDQAPAGPSRPLNRGPVEPAPLPVRYSGLVIDGRGQPVAAAQVVMTNNGRRLGQTVADTAGAYALTIDRLDSVEINVQKDGFEPSLLYSFPPASTAEVTKNLRLHEVLRISAGESVELSITEDDPACDYLGGLEAWGCRRVRIVSLKAGQLTVEVTSNRVGPQFEVLLPGPPYSHGAPSLHVTVAPGSETICEVLLIGGVDQTTTLTTRLEPS